jgi:6-phosphogluconolactonase (cycloisomerase 2 family)
MGKLELTSLNSSNTIAEQEEDTHFLYVIQGPTGSPGGVRLYEINTIDGSLTQIGTEVSTEGATGDSYHGVLSDNNEYFYVTNFGSTTVSVYDVDATTGELTNQRNVTAGSKPSGIDLHPSGEYLYVGNPFSSNISLFDIDSSGDLTKRTDVAGMLTDSWVEVHPSGNYIYYTNQFFGGYIGVKDIAGDGSLSNMRSYNSSVNNPVYLKIHPSGDYLYLSNKDSNNILIWEINSVNGNLTAATPVSIATGTGPWGIEINSTGELLYVVNSDSDDLYVFSINISDGSLTNLQTISTGEYPVFVTLDPTEQFLYVSNRVDDNVSIFKVNGDGTVSSNGTQLVGDAPNSLVSFTLSP